MSGLIVSMVLLGLAVAVSSPTSVLAVIVLLDVPQGTRRAVCFLAGWAVAIAVIGAAVALFPGLNFHSARTTPSRTASVAEALLGAFLVVAGIVVARRPSPATPRDPIPPRLTEMIGRHSSIAVAAGMLMLTYSITLAAAIEVLKADVTRADRVIAMAVFAVMSMLTIAAPVAVAILEPRRSAAWIAAGRLWLSRHSKMVTAILLVVIGVALVARGLSNLVG